MVIEASRLLRLPVTDTFGTEHGRIDSTVFWAAEARLCGFQVSTGVVTKFRALSLLDTLSINERSVIVGSPAALSSDLKEFDAISQETGPVVGVKAVTQSGRSLGKISDVLLEAETGFIIRFYVRHLLSERIIPRQYLVSITPRKIIFKDVVDTPLFDQVASSETGPAVAAAG